MPRAFEQEEQEDYTEELWLLPLQQLIFVSMVRQSPSFPIPDRISDPLCQTFPIVLRRWDVSAAARQIGITQHSSLRRLGIFIFLLGLDDPSGKYQGWSSG